MAQPGMEPWGFYTCGEAAYLARADALQRMGWLPDYSHAGGHALGIECKIFGHYVGHINECLVSGGAWRCLDCGLLCRGGRAECGLGTICRELGFAAVSKACGVT